MEIRVLGPVQAWADGDEIDLGPRKRRHLLALLALELGRLVPLDRLVDLLWGTDPPAGARRVIFAHVSRLRHTLAAAGAERYGVEIATVDPGYALHADPDRVDVHRFHRLVRLAAAADAPKRRADTLRTALELWRGEPLAGIEHRDLAVGGLEDARLAAVEDRVDADLGSGRHQDLVEELASLHDAHPYRERLLRQLMLAHYRSGAPQAAVDSYERQRARLADQLGLDLGADVVRLREQIDHRSPDLDYAPDESTTSTDRPKVVPAQLPATVGGFVGRGDQLSLLDKAVHESAVVLVTGSAGVGKTALTVRWTHQVRPRFPDGQLFVDLRGYSGVPPMTPLAALAYLLPALGVDADEVPFELDEASALFRELLAERRTALVLDNAVSAEQVRPLLPDRPGTLVVVTSRDRLEGLEAERVRLDVLDEADSLELLARVIGRERVTTERAAAVRLAELCAQLPLALRIAAANLTDDPTRDLAGYVRELEAGNRLAALEVEGDEETAVRGAIDLSYGRLEAEARRMFRLFGVVPGPDLATDAAAALAGSTTEHVGALLAQLANAHLVDEHVPGRFSGHDLLRLYARERSAGEEPAAFQRLTDWYLGRVNAAADLLYPQLLRLPENTGGGAAFPDPIHALGWLDQERRNLVALVPEASDRAYLLSDALRGFFLHRRHAVDWIATAEAGRAAAAEAGNVRAQAAAELSIAQAHRAVNRYDEALEHDHRAELLAAEAGWREGESAAVGNLGNTYKLLGRLTEAADHFTRALALDQAIGRTDGLANNLGNLGSLYRDLGRLDLALDHQTRALALQRERGTRAGQANTLSNLGHIHLDSGHLDEALAHLSASLLLRREIGDQPGEAGSLDGLASVHCAAGRYGEARTHADAALELARDVGRRDFEAAALNTQGTIEAAQGAFAQAVELHSLALALARTVGYRQIEADAGVALARALLGAGDAAAARTVAAEALAFARANGFGAAERRAGSILADLDGDNGGIPPG
ncbi:AfsR/SARP family transcriptional regulator [Tenggerimyces flavus]|uniref:BTAD domain-containing putative transcriptional regulator n=1 Tax=Tenggerimyces flavus TaxID=1708749 RepID=A0ABV7YFW3_9ACTN|nr:BTAD domain-containing putative transcriptional regulator [Tenggerimyces flavus]MBM7786824.1 DNA-binding SARP family transcriptional activator/tetratricopeptide (TPR) repeat protein [Tenggerimyces flavus]